MTARSDISPVRFYCYLRVEHKLKESSNSIIDLFQNFTDYRLNSLCHPIKSEIVWMYSVCGAKMSVIVTEEGFSVDKIYIFITGIKGVAISSQNYLAALFFVLSVDNGRPCHHNYGQFGMPFADALEEGFVSSGKMLYCGSVVIIIIDKDGSYQDY